MTIRIFAARRDADRDEVKRALLRLGWTGEQEILITNQPSKVMDLVRAHPSEPTLIVSGNVFDARGCREDTQLFEAVDLAGAVKKVNPNTTFLLFSAMYPRMPVSTNNIDGVVPKRGDLPENTGRMYELPARVLLTKAEDASPANLARLFPEIKIFEHT